MRSAQVAKVGRLHQDGRVRDDLGPSRILRVQRQGKTVQTTAVHRSLDRNRARDGAAASFACLALVLTLLALPSARSGASVTPARHARATVSAPSCASSGLVLWLERANSAAGTTRYDLHLTNLSGHSCTLKGYPAVSAVDLSGHVVGFTAQNSQNEHSPNPVPVPLANDATATAMIAITDAANFPAALCHLKMAAGLRVTPPNQSLAKVVPLPFPECTLKMPQILVVESVQRAPYSG